MALDAAEFISELDIASPPGTDPLNQGDDQIRTTKRATQQSFPLIAGAVSITHDQMNQMAIKNEVNVFTQRQDLFENHLRFDQGATNRGLQWRISPDIQWIIDNRASGSLLRFRRHNAGVIVDDPITVSNSTGQIEFLHTLTFDDLDDSRPKVTWRTNSLDRWSLGSVGLDSLSWSLSRFDDLGAFLDTPWKVDRAEGKTAFVNGIKTSGDAGGGRCLDLSGEGGSGFPGFRILSTTGIQRFNLFLFQSSNLIQMDAFDAAGVSVGTILTINLATRVVDFKVAPTVNGSPI